MTLEVDLTNASSDEMELLLKSVVDPATVYLHPNASIGSLMQNVAAQAVLSEVARRMS